ncbi:hypothetical protein TNIN_170921 [Trichonephila inaurata madagascariensis]|uniref:Uncharacterized protein n=1 Tax=Trichonephila inaurata madagascariensis TaxID=2747483 RepID=A0A8X7C7B3_9ARAC|nr:hypothetical protein TNIN_170921 [Trichonephila inaurata madagascariensis]
MASGLRGRFRRAKRTGPRFPRRRATSSMETDSITPDDDNEAKCAKLIDSETFSYCTKRDPPPAPKFKAMIRSSGEISSPTTKTWIKEIDKTSTSLEEVKGTAKKESVKNISFANAVKRVQHQDGATSRPARVSQFKTEATPPSQEKATATNKKQRMIVSLFGFMDDFELKSSSGLPPHRVVQAASGNAQEMKRVDVFYRQSITMDFSCFGLE